MEEQKGDPRMESFRREFGLVKERREMLAKSPDNSSEDLQGKRRSLEEMNKRLDETVGDRDFYGEMEDLKAEIEADENAILEKIEPGYVEKYNKRMAEIIGND